VIHQLLFWSISSRIYYDKPWGLTNNGKVASVITNSYKYRRSRKSTYWPNRTLFKTSSSTEGFIANETGTRRHATTITDSKLVDPIAVVQFTNLAKTVPISNPVQIRLSLEQPAATTTTATATTIQNNTIEIAALPP
jgi:hypothetical protein